jgi:hypothetical protein
VSEPPWIDSPRAPTTLYIFFGFADVLLLVFFFAMMI